MKKKRQVELLAPAGSIEGFYGAINAGADAVYLSGKQFGARAYATNFDTEEILACVKYAHLLGCKVYLTINTLTKTREFKDLYDFMLPLYEGEIDGVIVQDLGVIRFFQNHFPELELHASTQMTVTGANGCKFLQEEGISRVVPARELSLAEIETIKRETDVELECFIHGAMCYCYSGQCLFSSILGGRSGNRGRCAQPCRLAYSTDISKQQEEKEQYPLSLKDMNLISDLPKLLKAGIDSFKIEGRMKKPEYAAGVTSVYRKYIDAYYAGQSMEVSKEDLLLLRHLYTRSQQGNGYYFRQNGKDMLTLQNPSYNEMDEILLEKIRSRYLQEHKKLPISLYGEFRVGQDAVLTACYEDITVMVNGPMVDAAQKAPVTEKDLENRLGKLGDTYFVADEISVYADANVFLPVKAINELRRSCIEELEQRILEENGYGKKQKRTIPYPCMKTKIHEDSVPVIHGLRILCTDTDHFRGTMDFYKQNAEYLPERIYLDATIFESVSRSRSEAGNDKFSDLINVCTFFRQKNIPIYVALPYITRWNTIDTIQDMLRLYQDSVINGFLIRNLEAYGILRKEVPMNDLSLDYNMYIWNPYAFSFWSDKVSGFCLPIELRKQENTELLAHIPAFDTEKMIYGRLPMMQTANCILKTSDACQKANPVKKNVIFLKDRYNKQFPVFLRCKECYNTIYNSVPLSLHKDIFLQKKQSSLRLDFTTESREEVLSVLQFFVEREGNGQLPYAEFTGGHENRGVE